jgi:hypothetical protein
MAERPITIHSTCVTKPDQHVHVNRADQVRWHADHAELYVLHIPGGFFQNEPHDFQILVLSENWTKSYVVAGKPGSRITNYIYDLSGKNCGLPTADSPPDIIIDSTPFKRRPKPGGKKKTTPAKKTR